MKPKTLIIENISKTTQKVFTRGGGQKTEIKPGQALEFEYKKGGGYLATYPKIFKLIEAFHASFEIEDSDPERKMGLIDAFLKNIEVSKGCAEEIQKIRKGFQDSIKDKEKRAKKKAEEEEEVKKELADREADKVEEKKNHKEASEKYVEECIRFGYRDKLVGQDKLDKLSSEEVEEMIVEMAKEKKEEIEKATKADAEKKAKAEEGIDTPEGEKKVEGKGSKKR